MHVLEVLQQLRVKGNLRHICDNISYALSGLCIHEFFVSFLCDGVLSLKHGVATVYAHWTDVECELHQTCFDNQEKCILPVALDLKEGFFNGVLIYALWSYELVQRVYDIAFLFLCESVAFRETCRQTRGIFWRIHGGQKSGDAATVCDKTIFCCQHVVVYAGFESEIVGHTAVFLEYTTRNEVFVFMCPQCTNAYSWPCVLDSYGKESVKIGRLGLHWHTPLSYIRHEMHHVFFGGSGIKQHR